jgi:hypothetical protein
MSGFVLNEDGLWCPSCGKCIAPGGAIDEDDDIADMECRSCGFPDEDAVAHYHLHDDDDDECWQCGGEGVTYSCFEEFACIDPEGGCDECERRCDVCNGKGR